MNLMINWPTEQQTIADDVATSTAVLTTVASTAGLIFGGGDVVSASSLVMLSMLSCHALSPQPGVAAMSFSVLR